MGQEQGFYQSPITDHQSPLCLRCGTCCVAPDIASLGKPLGVPCRHLGGDGLCTIYDERPAVCRGYRPDELCLAVAAPDLAGRVANYLALFGLGAAAGN